jgi:lariat debranching enzyme
LSKINHPSVASDNAHQVIDIPTPEQEGGKVALSYDPEWLAITRAFQAYHPRSRDPKKAVYPSADDARAAVSREWDWVHAHVPPKLKLDLDGDGEWRVDACQKFVCGPGEGGRDGNSAAALAQTEAFAALLEMENVIVGR